MQVYEEADVLKEKNIVAVMVAVQVGKEVYGSKEELFLQEEDVVVMVVVLQVDKEVYVWKKEEKQVAMGVFFFVVVLQINENVDVPIKQGVELLEEGIVVVQVNVEIDQNQRHQQH